MIKTSKITRFRPSSVLEDSRHVALGLAGAVETENLPLLWAQALVACPGNLELAESPLHMSEEYQEASCP